MKKSKRLKEILKKIEEFGKESPYNYCDRWCERCAIEKQLHCTLYKDELERKITCIAHGRNEDDPEITEAVLEAQYKDVDKKLTGCMDILDVDLDNPDVYEDELDEESAIAFEDLPQDVQKHIKFVENNPLDASAKSYYDKAHTFLAKTFYKDEKIKSQCKGEFEAVSWYHTLLPAKLHRALCGFHEPAAEGDISPYDAIAQFQICKKSINESLKALKKIKQFFPSYDLEISKLIALLYNIHSRIEILESKI